jgi:hypothetical protein
MGHLSRLFLDQRRSDLPWMGLPEAILSEYPAISHLIAFLTFFYRDYLAFSSPPNLSIRKSELHSRNLGILRD